VLTENESKYMQASVHGRRDPYMTIVTLKQPCRDTAMATGGASRELFCCSY